MIKQIKKLNLNKTTISNLDSTEMNKQVGGDPTNNGHTCGYLCTWYCGNSNDQNTCKCTRPKWNCGNTG